MPKFLVFCCRLWATVLKALAKLSFNLPVGLCLAFHCGRRSDQETTEVGHSLTVFFIIRIGFHKVSVVTDGVNDSFYKHFQTTTE